MATPHDTVTIVVSGEVALADFAKAIAHFDDLMKNLSSVSGVQDVVWVIDNLEFSSTIATARGIGEPERVKKVVHDYETVGTALEQNTPIPFPDKVQRAAYGIRKIVRGKIESVSLETASREAIIRPPSVAKGQLRIAESLDPLALHPPVVSLGSIHGRVQTLTNRGGLRFTLYDLLHDKAVSCYLKEGYEEMMRDAWGKLALVTGVVTRDPLTGRPLSIRQVSEVVEEKEELGDYRDARGASPPLTDLSRKKRLEGCAMPDDIISVYWDADVFLSYVNGTPDRLPHLDALLEQSGKDIRIYTSTISIVEVAFGKAEQDKKVLDAETEKKINRLWLPGSAVSLIEFHSLIAHNAKTIMRYAISQGWQLKPMDAIHLATARSISAKEIHTYDPAWDKYSVHLGIAIGRPIAAQPKLL